MSKLEKFKAAFLPDSRLAKNLGNRVRAALSISTPPLPAPSGWSST